MERYCLVTVGATVGFKTLTKTALQPDFWKFLDSQGFTELHVQCGPDVPWATADLESRKDEIPSRLKVLVFESSKNLMKEEMTLCKPIDGKRQLGLVISHSGTGTILDAWKLGLPLVVVPNTELLDNHQAEMAKHLQKEGYATMSTSQLDDIRGAIRKADLLWEDNKSRWPPNEVSKRTNAGVHIWSIDVEEVSKEEDAHMAHD